MVLLFYTTYSLVTDSLVKIFDKTGILTDNFYNILVSLFTIVEFVSFCLFFYYLLKNLLIKRVILLAIILFIPFCFINLFLQYKNFTNLDTIPVTFQAIFVMSLCVYYFFEQIKNPKTLFIYNSFDFWAVTGILIYLSGTFFIFLLSSNLTEKEFDDNWYINYIFNILKNLLFSLSVFLFYKKRKESKRENEFLYNSILKN